MRSGGGDLRRGSVEGRRQTGPSPRRAHAGDGVRAGRGGHRSTPAEQRPGRLARRNGEEPGSEAQTQRHIERLDATVSCSCQYCAKNFDDTKTHFLSASHNLISTRVVLCFNCTRVWHYCLATVYHYAYHA